MNKTEKFDNKTTGKIYTLIDSATTLSMPKKPNYSKDSDKTKTQKPNKEKAQKK